MYNVPNVVEWYPLTKQRNIPRGFHQLIPNWQENLERVAATFRLVESQHTIVLVALYTLVGYKSDKGLREKPYLLVVGIN